MSTEINTKTCQIVESKWGRKCDGRFDTHTCRLLGAESRRACCPVAYDCPLLAPICVLVAHCGVFQCVSAPLCEAVTQGRSDSGAVPTLVLPDLLLAWSAAGRGRLWWLTPPWPGDDSSLWLCLVASVVELAG